MFYPADDILDFFAGLNNAAIDYVLIKNIGSELPAKLKLGKDIDVLVHPDSYTRFLQLMPTWDYKEIVHPHGEECGWKFIYGMYTCHKFEHRLNGVQIDGCAQLPTKSIGMNTWIPLDKSIQESVWRDKAWNEIHHWWQMDEKNLLVYLVARSVFEKEKFSAEYVAEIEKLTALIDDKDVKDKFAKVFFKFTPLLLTMLHNREYKNIRTEYLSFADY